MRPLLCALCLVFVVGLFSEVDLLASDLKLDGKTSVSKLMGDPLTIEITGAVGKPVTLLADVLPGPTWAFGQSVPLGFTPLISIIPLPPIPGGGKLTLSQTVPSLPSLDGQQIYMLAVVHDPGFPFGYDFSNGADLLITAPPEAGANQGTLVGRTVVLDGSDVAKPDGTLEPHTSIDWFVAQSPPGSSATVVNPQHPFATLTPDVPGDYVVRAHIVKGGVNHNPTTTIHAWELQTTPLTDGSIINLGSFAVSGTVDGPPMSAFARNGAPMVFDSFGKFGPFNVDFGPDEVTDSNTFRMTHADGSTANYKMTVLRGYGVSLATTANKTLAAHLNESSLNMVGDEGELQLEAVDIKSLLLALPPQKIAEETGPFGITLFSATIDFDNLTYNSDLYLTLDPTTGGIKGTVKIYNVKAYFRVWGEIIEIDYNLKGDITTSPIVISANLVGKSQAGTLKVDVTNVDVDSQNFNFNLNGFFGSVAELFIIESSVKEQVESVIGDTVKAELGPAIQDILRGFEIKGSLLSTLLVDIDVEAPISGVVHSNHGVTIQLDGKTVVKSAEPGSPLVTQFRSTSAALPTFGPVSPSGATYGAALSMGDDFVNQILAAATRSGLLDGDLTSLFDTGAGKPPVSLLTDQLALLIPDCGFDHWPTNTEVRLRAHGTVPPTLQLTPGGPTMAKVHLSNLEVDFEVEAPYGFVPHLLVSMDGVADVNLGVATAGNLEVTLVGSTLEMEVLRIYPGADAAAVDSQVSLLAALLDFALPDLIQALGTIPLPSLQAQGLGLQVKQIMLFGPDSQYVGMFGNLLLLP